MDGNRIAVIPPHVPEYFYHLDNKVKLREKLGLPLDKILILSVSSAQPRKNLGMVKKVVEEEYEDGIAYSTYGIPMISDNGENKGMYPRL